MLAVPDRSDPARQQLRENFLAIDERRIPQRGRCDGRAGRNVVGNLSEAPSSFAIPAKRTDG
jgi:hypothetical protein